MVGNLVPASFILGNILFIGLTAWSKEVSFEEVVSILNYRTNVSSCCCSNHIFVQFRGALNVAALSAFLTYVGAGLDGQAGMCLHTLITLHDVFCNLQG